MKAGCSEEEIEYLGKRGQNVRKTSRRDLSVILSRGEDGATTVTTTMLIAHLAGIQVFATGGIGGVHRGAETTMDISADLEELYKLSDTILVMYDGGFSAYIKNPQEVSEKELGTYMLGVHKQQPEEIKEAYYEEEKSVL